jgi:hypothetical protein
MAEATTNTALPDVVTSLPPAGVDVGEDNDDNADAKANTDSVTNVQSNNHPRATDQFTSTSTSEQGIKLEPVIKTETAPAPKTAPANTSPDQAEASTSTEPVPVINVPNLNRTVTVRRKAAKRTDPLYLAPPPQNIVVSLPLSHQAEEIPARKKPRVEEPLLTTTDEAAGKTASPDISAGLPSPATPPSAATLEASARGQRRRQSQLPPTETSAVQLDDSADLSGPVPPPTANVNTSIRRRSTRRTNTPIPPPTATLNAPTCRRSSRSVIPTSSTDYPVPPPSTVQVDVPTRRQNRR